MVGSFEEHANAQASAHRYGTVTRRFELLLGGFKRPILAQDDRCVDKTRGVDHRGDRGNTEGCSDIGGSFTVSYPIDDLRRRALSAGVSELDDVESGISQFAGRKFSEPTFAGRYLHFDL